jgi:hypothetical protein
MSSSLWHGERAYPRLLPLDLPFEIPHFIEKALFLILISGLLLSIYKPARILMRISIFSMLLLMAMDMTRWQPWPWLYILLLFTLTPYVQRFKSYDETRSIHITLVWILAGFYIWSGIHKLNPLFFKEVIPYLASPVTEYLWQYKTWIHTIMYAAPFLEIGIGALLLLPPLRKYAVVGAILLHFVILALLGPAGLDSNRVIWPWNITLILVVWLVGGENITSQIQTPFKVNAGQCILIALACLLPALRFTEVYPKYLAFELYSGTNTVYDRPFSAANCQIPVAADPYVYRHEGKLWIKAYDWSMAETNVPPCPDKYCLEKFDEALRRKWCLGIE